MNEFDIIKQYFDSQKEKRADVLCGIGDDAAIVKPKADEALVITTDTLVADVHFFHSSSPYDIAYKSLAVNLSDLAAMGARPAWITLALTLPNDDEEWLAQFSKGLFHLANQYHIQLIGGDLTHGPLSVTITAFGFVPTQKALLRSHAKPSDLIYVTGTLGDAGLALAYLNKKIKLNANDADIVLKRFYRPEPRLAIGEQIRDIAHAAIDISDGLAADLNHILKASHVGANIIVDALPLSTTLKQALPQNQAIELALTAGDDYELCFTVPSNMKEALEKKLSSIECHYTCIGNIRVQLGLDLHDQHGKPYEGNILGYQHF